MSTSNSGFFCDLCKLDFTTKEELKEHTWTILHHGKLNKSKGRGCVHECSLCNQTFDELLLYTKHLHGDTHQERYTTWKKDQSMHYPTRSYSPIDTSLASNQSLNTRRKLSTRNSNQSRKNARARPERPTSGNRNRTERHNTDQALPLHLNTFPVENSRTMTESGIVTFNNDNFEINSSNNLNFYDRIKTRKGNSKRGKRNKGDDGNQSQSNQTRRDSSGKNQKNNDRNSRRQKKQAAKRRSQRLSNSLDKSAASLDGTGLSNSIELTRSLTPLMDVNIPSKYFSLQPGKDKDGITSTSTNETAHNNQGIAQSLGSRGKYVWFSDSFKNSFGMEDKTTTSVQETSGNNISKAKDRWGVSHSIVGKGADETKIDTSTEMIGHDNGNPQDPNTEIISSVLDVKHSELQAKEKVPFVSLRRTNLSNAKNNTNDLDMTMDTDSRISATNILSETNNNSTENETKSTNKKVRTQLKTNSRLRSRSSSDDTALLSRQNSIRSSAIQVTQYQPFDKTAHVGTLEINPSKQELNLKDTQTTESPIQNSDKDKEKTKRNNPRLLGKNGDSGLDGDTIKEQENNIGEEDSITQCSFVHIDGVRCSAKTSERLCSYHKRFPEGNLIKSEPQDDHPASTSLISLDLSTTTLQQDNMSFNQRCNDSGYPREALKRERTTSGDKKIQMMDLSMSTNFLSLAHSHMGMPNKHGMYPDWVNKRPHSREDSPPAWTRGTSAIILPTSRPEASEASYSKAPSSSTWFSSDHNGEPVRTKLEPVSPNVIPPSSPRESAGPGPTLDLSRLNLPANVRRALAMKYASKNPESASTASSVAPNLSISRSRFVEKGLSSDRTLREHSTVPYQSVRPLPSGLRAARIRQQRSISLDSYPASAFERPGLMPSHEPSLYGRAGPPLSPLIAQDSAFSIPISKQSTTPEKAKMIDLNASSYLPSRHTKISKMSASNQEKEAHLEKHGIAELGRTPMDKDALMSKFTIPALRTKIRTMSTERDSAYYKEDSSMYHPASKPSITVPERRSAADDKSGRYVVLETRPATSTTHVGVYHPKMSSIKSPTPYTYGDPKTVFDFTGSAVQSLGQRAAVEREREKEAAAIALEDHFRQSLNPVERTVGTTSKLPDHGMIALGSSTIDAQRKTASPRDTYPVSTYKSAVSSSRPPITTHVDNASDHSTKRKAEDVAEPELKKRKAEDVSSLSQRLSYLPGLEVQELLRLEHHEQSQLKSLQDVQDKIKATRVKLQALTIELESLQAKEKRISEEISHTKNKRVEILQGALHRSSSPLDKASSSSSSQPSPASSSSTFTNGVSSNETHLTASLKGTDNIHLTPAVTGEASITQTNNLTGNHNLKDVDADHGSSSSSQSELSKTLTDSSNRSSTTENPPVKVKMEVDEESKAQPCSSTSVTNNEYRDLPETQGNHTADEAKEMISESSSKALTTPDNETKHDENFEKSKKEFLSKIKKDLSVSPKKRHQFKTQRKKFSEAKISNSIALSRDKILLVREKMRGWKVQQESNDSNDSNNRDGNAVTSEPSQEVPTSYKDTTLTPSKIPERDVSCGSQPHGQSSKQRHHSSSSSKSDTKTKGKLKVVSKKGLSHTAAKSQLRKKRKSSHPSKRETVHTSSLLQVMNKEDCEGEPQQTNSDTKESTSDNQFHLAAVESLRQKLKKSNSGSKELSTSKARESSFEGHTGAVCALKYDDEPTNNQPTCGGQLESKKTFSSSSTNNNVIENS